MRGRRYKPPTRLNAQGSAESASDDEDGANGNEEAEGQEGDSEQDAKLVRLPDGTDAIDITDDWRSGGLVLSEAGTYALSGDVETTGMLTIAAPAGEVVVLDFAGHKATVNSDVYAGIDVGSSVGEVVIRDSSYKDGTPNANLVVEGNKVADALCGIQANYAPQEGDVPTTKLTLQGVGIDVNLNTVDADHAKSAHDAFGVYFGYADGNDSREAVDALLQNVSVSVHLNEFDLTDEEKAELKRNGMVPLSEKTTGIAYGIYTNVKEVGLSGVLATTTDSANNTCDLYSVNDASFRFDRTSEPQNMMRVYAAGNGENTVLATLADDFEDGTTVLSSLENASDSETILKQNDRAIIFAKAEDLSTDSAMSINTMTNTSGLMNVQSASITIDPSALTVVMGATAQAAVSAPEGAEVTATSSDESVATASYADGALTVTGVAPGSATVTVSAGEASAELAVEVSGVWSIGSAQYGSTALAFAAAQANDTLVLNADLPGQEVGWGYTGADRPVTVDLAGHEVGKLAFGTASDVSVISTGSRAKVTGIVDKNVVTTGNAAKQKKSYWKVDAAVSHPGSGSLSIIGVDVAQMPDVDDDADVAAAVEASAETVSQWKSGIAITAVSAGGEGATTISGASISLPASDLWTTVTGVEALGSGTLTLDGCTVEAGAAPDTADAASLRTGAAGSLALAGATSVSGAPAVLSAPISLSSTFSAGAGAVTVSCPIELEDSVFATVAEGGDAQAAAQAFSSAEADANVYKGLPVTVDGSSLKLAAQTQKIKVDIPEATSGLVYTGAEQIGVASSDDYTVEGGAATVAGTHVATLTLVDKTNSEWADGTTEDKEVSWSIAKAILTAAYEGEEIASPDVQPALLVAVSGFVNDESADNASGYAAPTLSAPQALEAGGTYELTPSGGSADNYEFEYVSGSLKVLSDDQLVTVSIHSNWPEGSNLPEETKTMKGKPGDQVKYTLADYGFEYRYWRYTALLDAPNGQSVLTQLYPLAEGAMWTIPDKSIDLYPSWTHMASVIQYRNLYLPNGRDNASVSYSGFMGDPVLDTEGNLVTAAPVNRDREGYTFKGWKNFDTGEVYDADKFVVPLTYPEQAKTVYDAVWQAKEVDSVENVDLYTLLTENDVPLKNKTVTLTKGSYYLSKTVDGFTGTIKISKAGEYSIDLRGNSIIFGDDENGGSGSIMLGSGYHTLNDQSNILVEIDGGSVNEHGKLVFKDGGTISVQSSSSLTIRNVDMSKSYLKADAQGSFVGSAVISAPGDNKIMATTTYPKVQEVTIENCNIDLDLSNQINGGSTTHDGKSAAYAIGLTSPNLKKVEIVNSDVSVRTGVPSKTDGSAQGSVDAIALYSCNPAEDIRISDSNFAAQADQGSAFAIYQYHSYLYPKSSGMRFEGDVALKASAGGEGQQFAVGLMNFVRDYKRNSNTTGSSIVLNGTLNVDVSGSRQSYALASDNATDSFDDAPFVIGGNFTAENKLSVLNDMDFSEALERSGYLYVAPPLIPVALGENPNSKGSVIARFDNNVDNSSKEAMADSFSNGLAGGKATVVASEEGLAFDQDASSAEAYIERDGEWAEYGLFEDVARVAKSGDTITLNKGVSRIVDFPQTDEEKNEGADPRAINYIVNLNGYSFAGLSNSSDANVTVMSGAEVQPTITGAVSDGNNLAMRQSGAGLLTLSGVNILILDTGKNNNPLYGVLVEKGNFKLVDSDITLRATGNYAYGVSARGGTAELVGSSIECSKSLEGTGAYAIDVRDGGVAALNTTSVQVSGSASQIRGCYVDAGTLSINDASSVKAVVGKEAASVAAVFATGASKLALDGSTLEVRLAEGVSADDIASIEAWDILTALSADDKKDAPVIELAGACTFVNDVIRENNIRHEGAPIVVAENLVHKDGAVIGVHSGKLGSGDVLAVPAAASSNLSSKAAMFQAVAALDNEFAGCEVATSQDGSLYWKRDSVAMINGKGEYASVTSALAAADAGDTIVLLKNASSLPLNVTKDITLDLSGHELTLVNAMAMGRVPSAVAVSAGRLTITDAGTDSKGKLVIGISQVASQSAVAEVSGFLISDAGALTIDRASVDVYEAGNVATDGLYGIFIGGFAPSASHAVSLASATINVGSNSSVVGPLPANACDAGALAGARNVTGIHNASETEGNAISIDAQSSVHAITSMPNILTGEIVESNQSSNISATENALNQAHIREFDPASDPELYKRICDAFIVNAKFDADVSSGVYGARIYYAAPMKLDDGTYVWAFSDRKSGDEVGKDIVPTIIYVQSRSHAVAEAKGISSGGTSKGTASISGSVSATSMYGNAYAVFANGEKGEAWNIDGGTLDARSLSSIKYLAGSGVLNTPNILERVGFDSDTGVDHFYPKQSLVGEIVEKDPSAYDVYIASKKCAVTLGGSCAFETDGSTSANVAGQPFAITADFTSDGVITVAGEEGNRSSDEAVFASLSGDGAISPEQRDMFDDAFGEHAPILADNGAKLKWSTLYKVSFVDAFGSVIFEEDAAAGYEINPPAKEKALKSETATTEYELVGWSTQPNAKAGDNGVEPAESAFVFAPPKGIEAGGDVVYYPVYEAKAKKVAFVFAGAHASDGSVIPNATVAVDAGKGIPESELDKIPAAASYGNRLFIGWEASLASFGNERSRTVETSALGNVTSTKGLTFTAKYVTVPDGYAPVLFRVDDYVYGYAIEDGMYPEFREAMKATTGETDEAAIERSLGKEEAGIKWTFAGWVAGNKDYSTSRDYPEAVDFGPNEELPVADASADAVASYTASFKNEGKTFVTITLHYYNDWKADGNWTYNRNALTSGGTNLPKDKKRVTYGTNIGLLKAGVEGASVDEGLAGVKVVDYAVNTGSAETPEWRAHKLLGWSTRPDDKLPLSDELLPRAGLGTLEGGYTATSENYYAIYSDVPMVAAASFHMGDSVVSVDVSANGTLDDALAVLAEHVQGESSEAGSVENGSFVPTAPSGKKFAGWAKSEKDADNGVTIRNPALSKVALAETFDAPKDGDGRSAGSVSYYAVFVDGDPCKVTLDSVGADNWSESTYYSTVVKGSTIVLREGFQVPHKAGYAFTGWNTKADGSGNTFNLGKDSVNDDALTLFAQYEEIQQPKPTEDGAAVDVSGIYLSKSGALDADEGGVSVTLEPAKNDDSAIALGQRDRALGYYSLKALVKRSGVEIDVTDQLEGTIRITLPVPDGYADKELLVFVKTPDGESKVYKPTVNREVSTQGTDVLATQAVEPATATVSIPAIGASSLGNITLAWRMSQAEYDLGIAKSSARSQLQDIANGYNEADYDATDWSLIEDAANKGYADIEKAANAADAYGAAQAASDAMAAVPTKKGLDTAKAEGLARLANAYSDYDKANYSDATWKSLKDAYETAKQAVNNAKSASEANKAASNGILAMASLKPDASSGSTSNTGNGSGNSSGTGASAGANGNSGTNGNSGQNGTGDASANGESAGSGNGLSSGSGNIGQNGTGGSSANSGSSGSGNGLSSGSTTSSGLASSSGSSSVGASSGLSSTSGTGLKSSSGAIYTKETLDEGGAGLANSAALDPSASVLGGELATVDDALVKSKNLKVSKGVYVASVVAGGPLDAAGIEEGDVITAIDGQEIESKEDLEAVLADKKPGEKIEVTVDRDGKSVTYTVEVGEAKYGLSGNAVIDNDDEGLLDSDGLAVSPSTAPDWLIPACILGIVLLGAIAALVWWLMRRRNDGGFSDDDFWEEAPAMA